MGRTRTVACHVICKVFYFSFPFIFSVELLLQIKLVKHSGQLWLKEEISRAPTDRFPPLPRPIPPLNLQNYLDYIIFRPLLVPLFYFYVSFPFQVSGSLSLFHSLYPPLKRKIQRSEVRLINMEKRTRMQISFKYMVHSL